MTTVRTRWRVISSSWGLNYEIEGSTLGDAITSGIDRIVRDAVPMAAGHVVSVGAEWQAKALNGLGGIMVEMTAVDAEGNHSTHYALVAAAPEELPDPLRLEFSVPV